MTRATTLVHMREREGRGLDAVAVFLLLLCEVKRCWNMTSRGCSEEGTLQIDESVLVPSMEVKRQWTNNE